MRIEIYDGAQLLAQVNLTNVDEKAFGLLKKRRAPGASIPAFAQGWLRERLEELRAWYSLEHQDKIREKLAAASAPVRAQVLAALGLTELE
jgi:hypothetical protein